MTSITTTTLFAAAALGLATAPAPAGEPTDVDGPTYRLQPGSMFARGCVPPCMCPILLTEQFEGTFRLQPVSLTGTFDQYDVLDVDWTVQFGGDSFQITGDGTYTIFSEVVVQQRLELDLLIGDERVEHFDSDWVLAEEMFPAISIAIESEDVQCFGTFITINAVPVRSDVNGDGVVNVDDLLEVITHWGPCLVADCPWDITGDGQVGVDDLLAVIMDWS